MTNFQEFTHQSSAGTLLRGLATTALVAALGMASPAQAAEKSPAAHMPPTPHASAQRSKLTPAQKKQFEAFQKTRKEMMQARGKLDKIQKAALKAHPELLKQQKSFGNLLTMTMKKNGYDAKKEVAELKALRSRLRDKKTPQAKKRKLAHQFQVKVVKLNKARGKALQDKKVQKARHSLQTAVISAMRKQDPNTDKLIAMVQSKQRELIKIRRSVLAQMQHNSKGHAAAHSTTKAK